MENQPALNLIKKLTEELDQQEINYCHWKSNAALARSANGDNDLDLLIHRAHAANFTNILINLGFKQVLSAREKMLPGILSYFGYDQGSDKFVHVHAHYQLVIGQDFTKNYHLPIEIPYLESSIRAGLFKIPAPEFEFILFVIRMVLKHSTWDTIIGGLGSLSPSEKIELDDLIARANKAETRKLLHEHLPCISGDLFNECLRSIQPGCNLWDRIKAGENLQKRLKPFSRHPLIADLWLKFWRRAIMGVERRISKKHQKLKFISGGGMVAIIGGDGAGKTTVVEGLQSWYSKHFETRKIHLGKPPWSLTTTIMRAILKIGRSLGLYPFENTTPISSKQTDELIFPGYPSLIRSFCIARDRFLTYAKARRLASNGTVIICDRFPLPYLYHMESPHLARTIEKNKQNRFIRLMAKLEERYYQSILIPEIVIVLRVDPQIAIQRKQEEDEKFVFRRSEEVWNFDWQKTSAYVMDARETVDEVLSKVKSIVWANL